MQRASCATGWIVPEIAVAEAVGGLTVGIITTLGLAATFLKRKTDGLKVESEQQAKEHEVRLALLTAERTQIENGHTVDLAAMVTTEVQRLLPEAVARLQEEERLRVALEREKEHELMERLKKLALELNDQRGGPD